ncbi:cell shape determination protein CcmA [Spirosoma sp. HMF3257]|uniref:Cell shape determination protein CcmA n=1 Tax=Spirosoma telluris TaxID=2183553 RepID=A0A327NKE2_9BACT|nr:cell shape determination protein CcmA [Spirosoma telluris]RAI75255.1 cell shape determination protein CcmA [Spirosoma telluris]
MNSTISLSFAFLVLIGLSGCRVQNSPPELTGLSAKQAFIGDNLTLTGYQFGPDPTVTFGIATSAVTAPISSHDDNTIQLKVPLIAPGPTQIRVRTDEGTSDPLPFDAKQPVPALAAVEPSNGLPGSIVVLTGTYLNQIKRIRFDDVLAEIKDSSAQKLTIVVPSKLPHGPVALAVETTGGTVTSKFIVAGTPKITTISPLKAKPGTELVIQGQNLIDGIVSINGLPTDKALTTVKDTEIRTTIPATATSGLVTVTVFETLVATSTDTLKLIQPPFITNLLALDGIAGDKLLVNGRNLRDITGMTVGNVSATFRIVSDTQLEVTIPALPSSGSVQISASSIGGNTTATDPFFFYLPPSTLVVTPTRQLRGRTLTVSGKNLYRITTVTISGLTVPITSRNEGVDLLIGIPDNAVSGSIVVTSRAGTASVPLVVVQPPVVTDILPAKARPGERIVVRGDFLLNAQFFFSGSTTQAADGGKNEDTERWLLVSTDAQSGPLRVVNAAGEIMTPMFFAPIRLVTITDFLPKTAKIGDEITITGQNLSTVTAVRFNGGTSAPATFRLSGSSLIATVPAGAVTGQICLTNDAGTLCTSANLTVSK